jgi:hypothetical protein
LNPFSKLDFWRTAFSAECSFVTRDPRSSNASRALPSVREPAAMSEIIGHKKSPGTEERVP